MSNNFEKALKEKKTTTYRVSKETGLPNSTLNEWKNGKYIPNVKTVKKVAEHLGVTMESLI